MVQEDLNGQIAIKYGKDRLQFKAIEAPQAKPKPYQRIRFNRQVRLTGASRSPWHDNFKLKGSLTTKRGHF